MKRNMIKRFAEHILLCAALLFAGAAYAAGDSIPAPQKGSARSAKATATVTKAQADSAYAHEDYETAAGIYEQLIRENGESAQVYFNLGNAYYRQDKMARAILNYERAALFDPGDSDIRFNLDMARSKTVDKIVPESELFFVTTFRSLVLSMSVGGWAWLAIAAFVLMLIAVGVYLFVPEMWAQKMGFVSALLLLIVCVFANVAAYQQLRQIEQRTGAIIMAPSVVVKSTPSDSGTDLFILHEGTRVRVVDDSMRDWCEIRMADGKEGWMQKSKMEVI